MDNKKDVIYNDKVNTKNKSKQFIEYFYSRQERLIPGSVKGGFCLFEGLINIMNENKNKCNEMLSILKDDGVTEKHISLCNWVCFNARTDDYHEDNDSSYTMICSPFVSTENSDTYNKFKGRYAFNFCWDDGLTDSATVSIMLDEGVSVFFLGPACSHRQEIVESGVFVNFSSYQNQKLYSNMKCSVMRCLSAENK